MKRALLLVGAVAALGLGGCMSTGQVKEAQDTCAPLGAPKGTENHEACRAQVAAVQEQAQDAKAGKPAAAPEPASLPAKR